MIQEREIDGAMAEFGVGSTTEPAPHSEADHEILTLHMIINRLQHEIWGLREGRQQLDDAANDYVTGLEGEITTWKVAAYALAAMWLVTIGGLWGKL
jgi:hypothetical protein